MRSHPPTLLTLARRTLREECGMDRGSHLLVAVSGGPDSMALLHVCCILLRKGALGRVTAHGIDHGLRPEAKDELALAAALAREHGVPFDVTRVEVPRGANLQARARKERYRALTVVQAKVSADAIATGHHQDDRAETVLIRLLRGAPLPALGVLPPRDGERVRPLIRASRADVLAHARRHGLMFAEDPSNASPRFLRARVRHELLPMLEALSPGIKAHLASLADQVRAMATAGAGLPAALPPSETPGPDPRVESKRALAELTRLLAAPKTHPRARVSLKGGVVLSVGGAQALNVSFPSKKKDEGP